MKSFVQWMRYCPKFEVAPFLQFAVPTIFASASAKFDHPRVILKLVRCGAGATINGIVSYRSYLPLIKILSRRTLIAVSMDEVGKETIAPKKENSSGNVLDSEGKNNPNTEVEVDPSEGVLLKQSNEIREYRRLKHEQWEKTSRKYKSNNPSKKSLLKEVVSSVTSGEGTQGDPVDSSEVSPGKSGHKKKKNARKKLKRAREISEGDKQDHKRNNHGPQSDHSPSVSPEVVDLDACEPPRYLLTDDEPLEIDLVDSEEESKPGVHKFSRFIPGEKNRRGRGQETVSKTSSVGQESDEEEILCLGVYSRAKKNACIDLTESPSPPSKNCASPAETVARNDNATNQSDSAQCLATTSSVTPLMNLNFDDLPVPMSQHVHPGPVPPPAPCSENQSPAFSNFLYAAAFGNAVYTGLSGPSPPLLHPHVVGLHHNNGVMTGMRSDAFSTSSAANCHYNPHYSMASSSSTTTTASTHASSRSRKSSVLRNRQWAAVGALTQSDNVLDFTLMSYNVLAQNLLENNSFLYTGSCRQHLSWSFRSQNLLQEIIEYTPDIICLQEVFHEHFFEFFQPMLEARGYRGFFKRRTRTYKDGCATFYRNSKFALEQVTPVEYFNPKAAMLDRDNIALILTLQPRVGSSSAKLIVSNTHLLFNPRRGDVKLAQLMVLLSEVDKLARINAMDHPASPQYHATILAGDFNLEPKSPIYRFLATGKVDYYRAFISEFSGQEEGMCSGGSRCFDREILPTRLGITDNCQYLSEVQKSIALWQRTCSGEVGRPSGSGVERGTGPSTSTQDFSHQYRALTAQCTGTLSTFLPLVSVYRHCNYSSSSHRFENEASTHHGRANCTVDYIFYSVHSRSTKVKDDRVQLKRVRECQLKLTKRLSLLTERQMEREGPLPNEEVSSDHIPLLAGFQLKLA